MSNAGATNTGNAGPVVIDDSSVSAGDADLIELRLYVAGKTAKSVTALANLKRVCETHLGGRYQITVIDLMENPALAAGDQIVAVPTLVRKLPEPMRRIIGDLSDLDRVLVGLDLRPRG